MSLHCLKILWWVPGLSLQVLRELARSPSSSSFDAALSRLSICLHLELSQHHSASGPLNLFFLLLGGSSPRSLHSWLLLVIHVVFSSECPSLTI